MAYEPPEVADFVARFPEFDEQADAGAVQAALDLAGRFVDDSWLEEDYEEAYLQLAAHFVGVGLANAQSVGQEKIEAISIGPLSIRYGKQISSSDLATSNYGSVYAMLRDKSHPAIVALT